MVMINDIGHPLPKGATIAYEARANVAATGLPELRTGTVKAVYGAHIAVEPPERYGYRMSNGDYVPASKVQQVVVDGRAAIAAATAAAGAYAEAAVSLVAALEEQPEQPRYGKDDIAYRLAWGDRWGKPAPVSPAWDAGVEWLTREAYSRTYLTNEGDHVDAVLSRCKQKLRTPEGAWAVVVWSPPGSQPSAEYCGPNCSLLDYVADDMGRLGRPRDPLRIRTRGLGRGPARTHGVLT